MSDLSHGVFIFPTDKSIRPDVLARAVEDRGFDSLWFPEHSHIPTSRDTPWGGQTGAPDLPEHYWRTQDQFVALAFAAAATSRLLLGTGITLVAQRDPIWTAKEVASLDYLSGGRVIFGVGYGWNKEEMRHHGTEYTERRALMREKILLMKSLWTDEEAEFRGSHIDVAPSWAWPKPVQRPHPPIIMGAAAGPKTTADIVEYCDGWLPLATRMDITSEVERIRQAVEDAGRDPETFKVIAYGAKVDRVEELQAAGVDHVVFSLPPLGEDVVIPKLDTWATQLELT